MDGNGLGVALQALHLRYFGAPHGPGRSWNGYEPLGNGERALVGGAIWRYHGLDFMGFYRAFHGFITGINIQQNVEKPCNFLRIMVYN